MDKQVQCFQIANLIFTLSENLPTSLSGKEIGIIQQRFFDIVRSFEFPETTQYATNYIKHGRTNLPYNSMTFLGEINNHLILHFTDSYKKPILFIIDTKQNKVKNYINIEEAKGILDDEIFKDIKDSLSFPKNLNRLFKGVPDIQHFIEYFETLLEEHKNTLSVTGYDCFEVTLCSHE